MKTRISVINFVIYSITIIVTSLSIHGCSTDRHYYNYSYVGEEIRDGALYDKYSYDYQDYKTIYLFPITVESYCSSRGPNVVDVLFTPIALVIDISPIGWFVGASGATKCFGPTKSESEYVKVNYDDASYMGDLARKCNNGHFNVCSKLERLGMKIDRNQIQSDLREQNEREERRSERRRQRNDATTEQLLGQLKDFNQSLAAQNQQTMSNLHAIARQQEQTEWERKREQQQARQRQQEEEARRLKENRKSQEKATWSKIRAEEEAQKKSEAQRNERERIKQEKAAKKEAVRQAKLEKQQQVEEARRNRQPLGSCKDGLHQSTYRVGGGDVTLISCAEKGKWQGEQGVKWGIANNTGNKLEVKFTKRYIFSCGKETKIKADIYLKPYETINGGFFSGDADLGDPLFPAEVCGSKDSYLNRVGVTGFSKNIVD